MWWVVGVMAAVVAVGCGRHDDAREKAGAARPAVSQPATSVAPLVTATTDAPRVTQSTTAPRKAPATTVARPPATAAPTTTTTTAAPPVNDIVRPEEPVPTYDENPWVVASPSRAPAGTRVFLNGTGFTGDHWGSHGQLWLSITGGSSCYLVASADSQILIDDAGHLEGSFVVPEKGACRFSTEEMATAGSDFQLAYQCTACTIGTFSVSPAPAVLEPGATDCGRVAYSHGPLEYGEIHVDGVACEEARAVLVGAGAWAPGTGPEYVEVAGFACDRIGESVGGQPTATYRCVKGSQTIWFIATGRA